MNHLWTWLRLASTRLASTAAVLLGAACGAGPAPAGDAALTDGDAGDAGQDVAETVSTTPFPDHPLELPFALTRPDRGDPMPADELAAVTDRFLELLERTRYFAFVDERAHGWPEAAPGGRYWYGTWWSGVTVRKEGGRVTYVHGAQGADNNGLRTAPLLEGACYATALWSAPEQLRLARKLMRGFISWILAMQRRLDDPDALLARAAYPESVVDPALDLQIDYAANRPGIDNDATIYVHVPDNPSWGDLWVKNKRSKDDIGHMFRAVAQLDACLVAFQGSEAEEEVVELRERYGAWARRVEDDGFRIATLDRALDVYLPADELARFIDLAGIECGGMLSIRLMGRYAPGDLDCGDGHAPLEEGLDWLDSSNMQIVRSFHEAAANLALVTGQGDAARLLLEGLAVRLEVILDGYERGRPADNAHESDVAALIIHAANAGVPLTTREVRWLHARIEEAFASYLAPGTELTYRVFEPATPDGEYPYEPGGAGLDFKDLGALLGSCASVYRNPAGRPALDCDRVRAFRP